VTFVSPRDKGILLKTCENGKQGDATCGFEGRRYPPGGEGTCKLRWVHSEKVDKLHIAKAESAHGMPRVSDGHESGFGK
jgi:hypothetical protein